MTSTAIRAYIGAPAPRQVVERQYPLEPDVAENLERLIVWIFGLPRSDEEQAEAKQSRKGRAISDSRHLNRLGKAIQHPRGLRSLEGGEDLAAAERAMMNERAQFSAALTEARDAIHSAAVHRPARLSSAADSLLAELEELVKDLRAGR
jgi:hypothetical protein